MEAIHLLSFSIDAKSVYAAAAALSIKILGDKLLLLCHVQYIREL